MDFLALFQKGGLVMYPLLLCSVIAIAILVERIRTYRARGLRWTRCALRCRRWWKPVM